MYAVEKAEKAEILLRNPNFPFRDPDPKFKGQALTHTELAYIVNLYSDPRKVSSADIAKVLAHYYPKYCKNWTGNDVDAIFDDCREDEDFGRWDIRPTDDSIARVLEGFEEKLQEIIEKK